MDLDSEFYVDNDDETKEDFLIDFDNTMMSSAEESENSDEESSSEEDIGQSNRMFTHGTPLHVDLTTRLADIHGHHRLRHGSLQSLSSEPVFPSQAYEEFVHLITEHNLSENTANAILNWGRKFGIKDELPTSARVAKNLVKSKIPQASTFHSHKLTIGIRNVLFHYRPIFEVVLELLEKPHIQESCVFKYEELVENGEVT